MKEENNNVGNKYKEVNARESAKRYQQYCWFLSMVKNGRTAVILSPDFVVVDWKTWRELNKKSEQKREMFFDEAGEISDEVWKLLEKKVKH